MKAIPAARRAAVLPVLAILAACAAQTTFEHDIAETARPWDDKSFDDAPGKFTFAVFSDLTGGERERIFDVAVAQLALLRPELILSVGDLIEGASGDPALLHAEWDRFDARASRAKAPVFRVGGNHDLTGPPLQRVWDERYGRRYYHFVYKDVLFLVLDTEDATPGRAQEIYDIRNEGIRVWDEEGYEAYTKTEYARMPERNAGNVTDRQADYFIDVLEAHEDVRWTFLFMHKSPWLRDDLDAFVRIETALADRPYTVFGGHFHAYRHMLRNGRDYIRLATTGGVQLSTTERAVDHVTLVTVDDDGVDIANLLLEGILDKTGHVPLGGDDLCFEARRCAGSETPGR